eukprot:jgi/Tetstr1/442778/TSEL_030863.t1
MAARGGRWWRCDLGQLGVGALMLLAALSTYMSVATRRTHSEHAVRLLSQQRRPASEHWVDSMPVSPRWAGSIAVDGEGEGEGGERAATETQSRQKAVAASLAPGAASGGDTGRTEAQQALSGGSSYAARSAAAMGTYGGGPNTHAVPVYDEGTGQWTHPGGEYLAFIGVFSYGKEGGIGRRNACRTTWFPNTASRLRAFEEGFNVKLRFVVGKTHSGQVPAEVVAEELSKGQHLHLNVIEEYDNLKLKMLRYFQTAPRLFGAKYYLKVDDDIYFRPDRVSHAVPQWAAGDGDFVGCRRLGGTMFDMPKSRYFDPQRHLMPNAKYFMYKAGPAYALSSWAASLLMAVPDRGLRFFGAGDASFGGWMLAFNVTHWEDRRLCSNDCSETNILGYYDTTKCNGLCNPTEDLPKIHADVCGAEPTIPRGYTYLPESDKHSYDPSKEKCHKVYADWVDHKYCRET